MNQLLDQRRFIAPWAPVSLPVVHTRTLVIGAGAAGLRAAIEAAPHGPVMILGKAPAQFANTSRAQGGIAVALHGLESCNDHVADTLNAGAGLCDEPTVREIIGQGREQIRSLIKWGMKLDRTPDGSLSLALEGAHSCPRVVRSDGDATGRELARCLTHRAQRFDSVRFAEGWYALDLITTDDGQGVSVRGVIAFHPRHGPHAIHARATILATGGAADLYAESSNPGGNTADGVAMAYRAGAPLTDLAFVQFHPTALWIEGADRHLITEAVRGEGAHLLDLAGRRFMLDQHPLAELAPRDILSRAIASLLARTGADHVDLDVRHIDGFAARFPGVAAMLASVNLDPGRDLIPVAPVAHFTIGGVMTSPQGRTSLRGLYAAGEVTCTGFHGANRLASNSLLESLVVGAAAARSAEQDDLDEPPADDRRPAPARTTPRDLDTGPMAAELKALMWSSVGIQRTGADLARAEETLDRWVLRAMADTFDAPPAWQVQNMLLVAVLITRSALWRTESRGGHWRADAPTPSPAFRRHDDWIRGRPVPTTRPVATLEPTPASH
ncbi:MAG: L-aspartate oxidase [Planctomycetes bacterium]|nr:L-aspartate oxidase [Planctomycetota bacterium]